MTKYLFLTTLLVGSFFCFMPSKISGSHLIDPKEWERCQNKQDVQICEIDLQIKAYERI